MAVNASEVTGLLDAKDVSSLAEANDSDLDAGLEATFSPLSEPCLGRLSPLFILVFLLLCQLVNYFDRGAVSALVKPIGADFTLSKFEQGLIGGAFMLGYMLFAPLSGFLTQYIRGTRVMAAGLTLWIAAAAVAAISWHLFPLLATRVLLGFGEATFAAIAPAIIDDISLPRSRSLWLSLYFMATPVGQALGFIAAGSISTAWSWRVVFIVEACLMLPFPIICFFLPHVSVIVENGFRRLGSADRAAKEEERLRTNALSASPVKRSFFGSLAVLLRNPYYVLAVLGFACLTFSIGGMTFWAAEYFTESLRLPLARVTLVFGIVAAVAGLVGAIAGGIVMDRMGGTGSKWGIPKAFALCAASALLATVFGAGAVMASSAALAFAAAAGAVVFFSVALAPINGVLLRVVPLDLRAFAIAINLFVIHLLGDFPSPILVGWVADALVVVPSCNQFCGLRVAMLALMCWASLAVVFWGLGLLISHAAVVDGGSPGEPLPATEVVA